MSTSSTYVPRRYQLGDKVISTGFRTSLFNEWIAPGTVGAVTNVHPCRVMFTGHENDTPVFRSDINSSPDTAALLALRPRSNGRWHNPDLHRF